MLAVFDVSGDAELSAAANQPIPHRLAAPSLAPGDSRIQFSAAPSGVGHCFVEVKNNVNKKVLHLERQIFLILRHSGFLGKPCFLGCATR